MSICQRIQDWRRERRINSIRRRFKKSVARGDKDGARALWAEYAREHTLRSPAQVARMEKARGLCR